MRRMSVLVGLSLVVALGTVASAQPRADVLLIDRVQATGNGSLPARGMTMAQVEGRFGAPSEKLEPRGGQKSQWPVINRWSYPNFTVYFERNLVIDAVVNKASTEEIGPKPVH